MISLSLPARPEGTWPASSLGPLPRWFLSTGLRSRRRYAAGL